MLKSLLIFFVRFMILIFCLLNLAIVILLQAQKQPPWHQCIIIIFKNGMVHYNIYTSLIGMESMPTLQRKIIIKVVLNRKIIYPGRNQNFYISDFYFSCAQKHVEMFFIESIAQFIYINKNSHIIFLIQILFLLVLAILLLLDYYVSLLYWNIFFYDYRCHLLSLFGLHALELLSLQ